MSGKKEFDISYLQKQENRRCCFEAMLIKKDNENYSMIVHSKIDKAFTKNTKDGIRGNWL